MKVKDLVKKLSSLDQNAEVYCYEEGPVEIQGPGPFDLVDVSAAMVELKRLQNGKPAMRFGGADAQQKVVVIGITPDF